MMPDYYEENEEVNVAPEGEPQEDEEGDDGFEE